MRELETHPPSAPRPFQVGAATPNPAADLPLLPSSSPSVPATAQAGLDLRFGLITPEIVASAAKAAADRRGKAGALPELEASSRASATLRQAGASSRPSVLLEAAAAQGRSSAACSASLPPPPPLRPGDRPCTLADLEAQRAPPQARAAGGRLRSIIIASKEFKEELKQRGAQDSAGSWQEVRPKFWWRKFKHSSLGFRRVDQRRDASVDLFKGACFRCLSSRHFIRQCKGVLHCLECKKPGHRARDCPSRRPPPAGATSPRRPPQAALNHLQANAAAKRMPSPRRRSSSEVEPGHPSNRPGEVYSSSLSTPAMEVADKGLTCQCLQIVD
ncbi:hypothetical protein QYE76_026162 [Lolium multiflorum]|uniref:CCHC-type domain-containing protein n=1 Tax=Lolium multiflorum TaxID=4521 RepID=A0AAD8VXA8_LOLMU|nr:hypothetical protein QYE76_026162 [Lolium multiflorum]